MTFLVLLAFAFVLMWLFLIRPQRRRQSDQVAMQENLSAGDEVVTAGGMYGTVESLDEDEVAVQIADGVVVRIARRAIAGVIPVEEDDAEELADEEGEGEPAEVRRS